MFSSNGLNSLLAEKDKTMRRQTHSSHCVIDNVFGRRVNKDFMQVK